MVKTDSEKIQRGTSLLSVAIVALIVLFICSIGVSSVAAGEIVVKTPVSPVDAGDTVTLPVFMNGATDIAAFTFDVSNNVPGAVITVDKNPMLIGGQYVINSDESKDFQHVGWFSTEGITSDSQEIFSLQVKVLDSGLKQVPITITPKIIVDSAITSLIDAYPVIGVESFPLDGNTMGKVNGISSTSPSPNLAASNNVQTVSSKSSATVSPSTSSTSVVLPSSKNSQNIDQSISENSPKTPQVSDPTPSIDNSVKSLSAESSPLGLFSLIAGLIVGLLVMVKRYN